MWPVGANPMCIWKMIALLEWKLFGLNPWWWHLVVGAMHASSAAFLFLLLRHYLPSASGAWAGSILWGLAAIGQPDNPLILLCCGNFVLAIAWLLLAMLLVPRFASNPSLFNASAIVGSIVLCLLTWGVMVALIPVVVLQYLILERRTPGDARPALRWVVVWAIPCLAAFLFQLHWMLVIAGDQERQRAIDVVSIVQRTVAQFGVAFNRLFLEWLPPSSEILVGSITLGLFALLILSRRLPAAHVKLLLLFFYVAAMFLVLTNIGGVEASYSAVLKMGHYHYIPILFWCVVAGVVIEMIVHRTGLRTRWIQASCGMLLLLGFAASQYQIAQRTQAAFAEYFTGMVADFQDSRTLLASLSSAHANQEPPLIVPDFRTPIPTHIPVFCPLSAFAAVCFPDGLANIRIVSSDQVAPDDVEQLIERLRATSNPVAPVWIDNLRQTYEVVRLVDWLSLFAKEEGIRLVAPNFAVSLPMENIRSIPMFCPSHASLYDYYRYACSTLPTHLDFDSASFSQRFPPPPDELRQIIAALRINPDPEARYWEATYSKFLPQADGLQD